MAAWVECAGPAAKGAARAVGPHVPAADDAHLGSDLRLLPHGVLVQEVDGRPDPVGVAAGERERAAARVADGHHHRVVGVPQFLQGDVLAHLDAVPELHAHLGQVPDLVEDHLAVQPVEGHAGGQQASRHRLSFVDGHAVADLHQVEGHRQAPRPRADDGHVLVARHHALQVAGGAHLAVVPLVALPMQLADGDGVVQIGAPADVLAGVVADVPQHPGQDVAATDHVVRLDRAPRGHQGVLAARVDVRGAAPHARGHSRPVVQVVHQVVELQRGRVGDRRHLIVHHPAEPQGTPPARVDLGRLVRIHHRHRGGDHALEGLGAAAGDAQPRFEEVLPVHPSPRIPPSGPRRT